MRRWVVRLVEIVAVVSSRGTFQMVYTESRWLGYGRRLDEKGVRWKYCKANASENKNVYLVVGR